MVRKGQDELMQKINASIDKLTQNGTISQTEKNWLTARLDGILATFLLIIVIV